jgi:hypothetical protein
MKKQAFIILMTLILASSVNAQKLKKFRFGAGVGFGIGRGLDAEGGLLIKLEPGYRLNNRILLSARIEGVFLKPGTTVENLEKLDFDPIKSFTLNCQYYFKGGKTARFVGVGVGDYIMKSKSNLGHSSVYFPGIYPRVGLEFKNFNLCLDYNMLPKSKGGVGRYPHVPRFYNTYLSLSATVFFGGGNVEKN